MPQEEILEIEPIEVGQPPIRLVRSRLDPTCVDPRLSFFASPGDLVCAAYVSAGRRLVESQPSGTFWVVSVGESTSMDVVVANLASALSIEHDVFLVDGKGDGVSLGAVFGLEDSMAFATEEEVPVLLVSERLGLVSLRDRSHGAGPNPDSGEILASIGQETDIVIVMVGGSWLDEVVAATESREGGFVVIAEQGDLGTGRFERCVTRVGASQVLGCLIVEDGRLQG